MKNKQTKSWHTYTLFLNKKCSINQENLWKKTKKQNTIANTEAELILRIFLFFVQSEPEYSYKL